MGINWMEGWGGGNVGKEGGCQVDLCVASQELIQTSYSHILSLVRQFTGDMTGKVTSFHCLSCTYVPTGVFCSG